MVEAGGTFEGTPPITHDVVFDENLFSEGTLGAQLLRSSQLLGRTRPDWSLSNPADQIKLRMVEPLFTVPSLRLFGELGATSIGDVLRLQPAEVRSRMGKELGLEANLKGVTKSVGNYMRDLAISPEGYLVAALFGQRHPHPIAIEREPVRTQQIEELFTQFVSQDPSQARGIKIIRRRFGFATGIVRSHESIAKDPDFEITKERILQTEKNTIRSLREKIYREKGNLLEFAPKEIVDTILTDESSSEDSR